MTFLMYHIQKVVRLSSLIVTYSLENTTSLFGEFLCQNLPIWQVFRSFSAICEKLFKAAKLGDKHHRIFLS
jgi:hypothetical protein